jgi:triosephosphate isomerase
MQRSIVGVPSTAALMTGQNRKRIVIASHKLFLQLPAAVHLAEALASLFRKHPATFDLVICPSLVNLAHVVETLRDSPVHVAAQNVHQEDCGAFTGQVSLRELIALNVRYVLVGHNELVVQQDERASAIAAKITWCVRHGVTPIACVADDGHASDLDGRVDEARRRLHALFATALADGPLGSMPVIVYEPRCMATNDTPETRAGVKAVVAAMRNDLQAMASAGHDQQPRVVFGGGVTEANVGAIMRDLDVDGVIVGRGSTDLACFVRLLEALDERLAEAC